MWKIYQNLLFQYSIIQVVATEYKQKWTDINMLEPSLSVIKMIRVSWVYDETYKEKELHCTQTGFPPRPAVGEKESPTLDLRAGVEERDLASQPIPW